MARRARTVIPEEDTELNMTPMLDVVFILLIFFIVTSVFVKTPGIDPSQPDAVLDGEVKPTILVAVNAANEVWICLLYTSPSPRDATLSRMPSSA